MIRLFTDTDEYTEDGRTLARECDHTLFKILSAWADRGYSIRDIATIAHSSVVTETSAVVLERRAASRRTSAALLADLQTRPTP